MMGSTRLLRQLIRESSLDLDSTVRSLQTIVGATQDGVWGEETQRMWTSYVYRMRPSLVGASIYELTSQWENYGDKITNVNGKDVTYTSDAQGALEFLTDISEGAVSVERPSSSAPEVSRQPLLGDMPRAYILGDSHAASAFGISLEKDLTAKGFDVVRKGIGATAAYSWLTGGRGAPHPSELNKTYGPFDLGIIVLGTNDGANSNVAAKGDPDLMDAYVAKEAPKIKQIADLMGAPITVWVGPPGLTGETRWYTPESSNSIYAHVSPMFPDTTFDSRHIRPDDGVHAYGSNAARWAQEVADFAASVAGG